MDSVLNVCLKHYLYTGVTGTMAQKDTARSILDSAEELFSERGFAETSLRNITTRAGVNLAAVNYHFGSKKELIQAVFARFLAPFCDDLGKALRGYEHGLAGQSPQLDALLRLLAETSMAAGGGNARRLGIFMRLLGLAYSQEQGHLRKFLRNHYGAVFERYMQLVTAASPELSDEERFWRIHFMLGATVFTLSGVESLTAMAKHDLGVSTGIDGVVDKLVPFLSSGFQAPHQE
jgi:AcrR family transcriptional regulator